jgi:RNA polymerase sigma-70 factor (ECF subfamily)
MKLRTEGTPDRPKGSTSDSWSARLVLRAKKGDGEALDRLFVEVLPSLKRWAHGRLPQWARDGIGTTDVVQDAALNVLRRLGSFEPRRRGGLRAYLRQAVQNRIRDLIRQRQRRGGAPDDVSDLPLQSNSSPWRDLLKKDEAERYVEGLSRLSAEDQILIVGRIDLGYDYDQLAVVSGRGSPDAARVAVRRALGRLAQEMGTKV